MVYLNRLQRYEKKGKYANFQAYTQGNRIKSGMLIHY